MRSYFSPDKFLHHAFAVISNVRNRFAPVSYHGDIGSSHLLKSHLTARADIEFTTKCNLSCVYCASLLPGYSGRDLDTSYLADILESLKRRKVLTVGVSGHGETTTVSNWHQYCAKMLDSGFDLYLSTNLARELSDEEIATLSRFHIIQVSCDTTDLRLFKKLRRGGDFRTLLYNMGRIRSRSIQSGERAPIFWWHCVVSDETVWRLEDHVAYGLASGVRLFNFINMAPHVGLQECPVGLITDMPREDIERLPAYFDRIFHMIKSNGASYICDSLMGRLREKLDSHNARGEADCDRRHYALQPKGMTRDCLDPWTYAKVASDTGVMPCCRTFTPVGFLSDGHKLDHILNNSEMMQFRESLLTGKLKEVCRTCNIRGWTDIEQLNFKVSLFLKFGKYLPVLHRWGILLPLLHQWRRSEL